MASKPLTSIFASTIGRKLVMAMTGLFLIFFSVTHLVGNFTLLQGADAFNRYTLFLESTKPLLYIIEIVLLAAFLIHAYLAVRINLNNNNARPNSYASRGSAGGPSRKSVSSVSMIYTGVLLLLFLAFHLYSFKFGTYYATTIDGEPARDLYRLVIEKFSDPAYAFGYSILMVLLGVHLRHGFWSAFQSLGLNHPKYDNIIYTAGVTIAVLLAVGFVGLPLYVFFTN